MLRIAKWLIYSIIIIGFITSATFGKFLIGLKSIFGGFAVVINGEVSSEVIFFATAVVVFISVCVYSIFRD